MHIYTLCIGLIQNDMLTESAQSSGVVQVTFIYVVTSFTRSVIRRTRSCQSGGRGITVIVTPPTSVNSLLMLHLIAARLSKNTIRTKCRPTGSVYDDCV